LTTSSSITHTGGLRKRKDSFTNYSNNKAAATAPSPHTDVASLLPALPVGVGVVVPETVVLGEEEELVDEVDEVDEVVLAEGALDDLEAEAEAVAAASMELIRAEGTVTPAALQNDSANCRVFSWSAGSHLVKTQLPMLSMKLVFLQIHLMSVVPQPVLAKPVCAQVPAQLGRSPRLWPATIAAATPSKSPNEYFMIDLGMQKIEKVKGSVRDGGG